MWSFAEVNSFREPLSFYPTQQKQFVIWSTQKQQLWNVRITPK